MVSILACFLRFCWSSCSHTSMHMQTVVLIVVRDNSRNTVVPIHRWIPCWTTDQSGHTNYHAASATTTGESRHKYHFCRNTGLLSQHKFCCDKIMLVAKNTCCNKIFLYFYTSIHLSQQKTCFAATNNTFLLRQTRVCRDKKWYLWQLPPWRGYNHANTEPPLCQRR